LRPRKEEIALAQEENTTGKSEPFVFDAKTFVRPGFETEPGDWGTGHRIAELTELYPELSHWGALAVAMAWQGYSHDVNLVSWQALQLDRRDESFLNYCCWVQTRGHWGWEFHLEKLAQANDWK
jgi:hypothetical protein